jgi:archaellum biogenesis protein FlaJ (TadC family)
MKSLKSLFDYCFYRIAKAYRNFDDKEYCGWGYGILFASFGFIALALTTLILYIFHYKLTTTIIVIVSIPFLALDALFSIFLNKKDKYIALEQRYGNEKNSKLKGWLVFSYVVGSVVLFFVSMILCGHWVSVKV